MEMQSHLFRRALAAGLDYLLVFGLIWAYLVSFGEPTEDGSYQLEGCGPVALAMGIWFVLLPLLEGLLGFTLGKGLLGLQVVDLKGRKVSLTAALFRHCLDFVDLSMGGIVGALVVSFTPLHQRLGDLVAKTRVVSDQEVQALRTAPDVFR